MNRRDLDQRLLTFVRELLLALYVGVGLFGAAWIDFDFNEIYIQVVAFAVIPASAFYYGMKFLFPAWSARFPRFYAGMILSLVVALLPAQVLLINAATTTTASIKRDISRDGGLLTVAAERGGLGIVYRKRW